MNKKITVYDNSISARTYISYIAEQAGGFACIGRDGKLYIREIGQDEAEIPIELFSEYKYGEEYKVSRVSYEDGIRSFKFGDETRNTLWINQENMFIVDEEQVENIYNQVKELTINSFEGTTIIDPAIDIGDKVIIGDKVVIYQGEMELQGKFIASISSKIQSKLQEETTTRKPSQTAINRKLQSEIDQEGLRITQLAQEQTEQSQKLSKHEQTIDKISSKVEDIEDLTQTVDGIKYLSLSKCVEGNLLELHIYGNNTVFDYLYCSDDLYCSNDLYCRGDNRIWVLNYKETSNGNVSEEGTEIGLYELGIEEVLRQNEDVYDEYILKDGQAKIIRRINKDGSIKETEEIEDLGELKIPVLAGTNDIIIMNYTAKIKARYAVKNEFTNTFATKAEMKAEIKVASQEINLEVGKKVGANEIISKINMSPETVGINANKIELSANDILNLLAGNEINLGTKKITIKSDNFNVDKDGTAKIINAIINNATITGGKIKLISERGGEFIIENKNNWQQQFSLSGTGMTIYGTEQNEITIHCDTDGNVSMYLGNGNGSTDISPEEIQTTGNVFSSNISSDKRLKQKIKQSNINASEIIKQLKIRSFDWKKDKKHIKAGFIAQEAERIDENFVLKRAIKDKQGNVVDYDYYMNELPILATLAKAFQEQEARLEKLEKGEN